MLITLLLGISAGLALASHLPDPFLWGVLTLNLLWIGLLPRIFFQKGGRLTGRWWLTALPLLLIGCVSLSQLLVPGSLMDSGLVWTVDFSTKGLALGLCSVSMAGIAWAMGTHHQPISLWHQPSDGAGFQKPLVTRGPYRWVRHPFYSCFLLAEGAAVCLAPGPLTLSLWILGWWVLTWTARGEEAHWLDSPQGALYRVYAANTGRFIPRLFKGRSAHGMPIQG